MMNQFILELTTNAIDFIEHYSKYSHFLNHYIENATNGEMAIEFIQNGIIYLFKDYDTFKQLIERQQIPVQEMPKLDKFLFSIIYAKKDFPLDGFLFHIKGLSNNSLSALEPYFKSLSPQIEIKYIDHLNLTIFFPTYASFTLYLRNFIQNFKIGEKNK
jgi:hypothetical protein